MNELEPAIVRALEAHGGWITSLTLRDRLPNGLSRGEAFDVALGQLIRAKRVQMRSDDGVTTIYRLAPAADPAPTLPPMAPIHAPGPARAAANAFHPPPPALRVQMLSAGVDEVKPPNPNKVSHAKPKETSVMRTESPKDQILEMLKSAPMRTGAIAKRLDITEAGVAYHLNALVAAKKIGKASRQAPWSLLNGKGPAPTPAGAAEKAARKYVRRAKAARKAAPKKKVARPPAPSASPVASATGVQDLELKLQVLDAQGQGAGKIAAFVLREIREDLQRLAA